MVIQHEGVHLVTQDSPRPTINKQIGLKLLPIAPFKRRKAGEVLRTLATPDYQATQ
ncbi:hypothetical protein [Stygiolobus caldivivus]|uniref:hypothetical protein n=1 Tax=Stygiolobus caldivivus TaxID=2824673 RepID=UPI001C84A876|nr:hypothetical protein [Stygiolobus caldivivus]